MNIQAIKSYLLTLQQQICDALADVDGKAFLTDDWSREKSAAGISGTGITRVLENGNVIERGGVNFSHVFGDHLPQAATAKRQELAGRHFQALGLSLVIHPRNPMAPTTHMNIRFFVAEKEGCEPVWWFGGGFDLTPYYGFDEDCIAWHQTAKAACDPFGKAIYPEFKQWCDDYFFLKHRNEPRGIGGIFFDDLNRWDFSTCFAFMQSVGNHFLKAYLPILTSRKELSYTEAQREFQLFRRSRYVEFNLLQDRGTIFGIQSQGRTESILVSMPPLAAWHYNYYPKPDSAENKLYNHFLIPQDWATIKGKP